LNGQQEQMQSDFVVVFGAVAAPELLVVLPKIVDQQD
jgi:hypothetical protein